MDIQVFLHLHFALTTHMAQNSFFLLRITSVSLILHKGENIYSVIKCIFGNVLVFLGTFYTFLTFLGHYLPSGHEYENFLKVLSQIKDKLQKLIKYIFPHALLHNFRFMC